MKSQKVLSFTNFSFAIEVDGVAQPIITDTDGTHFVEAVIGKEYELVIKNTLSDNRIEVLTSIDGRDTLKDQPASIQNGSGMVVPAGAPYRVTGWRVNDNETLPFVFVDASSGLAVAEQATGTRENVGVIGVAVYNEYVPIRPVGPMDQMKKTRGWPDMPRVSYAAESVGTGMGSKIQHDPVGHTTFKRSGEKAKVIMVQYRTRQWLQDHGILSSEYPQAFIDAPQNETGYRAFRKVN